MKLFRGEKWSKFDAFGSFAPESIKFRLPPILMHPIVFYYPTGHEAHFQSGHPERPERIEAIRQALEAAGWWQRYPVLPPAPLPMNLLQAVHSPAYLSLLEMACRRGSSLDADTYTTPASWQLALNAAGGAVAVAQAVWRLEAQRGFVLCRPPGHHAMRGQGMGFCLLNNIAIAAESIHRLGAERLAIVDLDLHHGNGTQDIFWPRGDVLYISTHQSPLYPGTGGMDETGAGEGQGATANFPLPPFSGDTAFRTIMDELILPLLTRFSPQMLLVSFGFDTHWLDPLGYLTLSAAGSGGLISSLCRWADEHCAGKLALVLEGGYDLEAAAACSTAVAAAMLGEPFSDPLGVDPNGERDSWKKVVERAKTLWRL